MNTARRPLFANWHNFKVFAASLSGIGSDALLPGWPFSCESHCDLDVHSAPVSPYFCFKSSPRQMVVRPFSRWPFVILAFLLSLFQCCARSWFWTRRNFDARIHSHSDWDVLCPLTICVLHRVDNEPCLEISQRVVLQFGTSTNASWNWMFLGGRLVRVVPSWLVSLLFRRGPSQPVWTSRGVWSLGGCWKTAFTVGKCFGSKQYSHIRWLFPVSWRCVSGDVLSWCGFVA